MFLKKSKVKFKRFINKELINEVSIQFISDTHGSRFWIDPDVDLYVLLGDNGMSVSMDKINDISKEKMVISLLGDHDSLSLCEKYSNIKWVKECEVIDILGCNVLCVPGCVRDKSDGEIMWSQKEYKNNIKERLKTIDKIDMIFSHAAPSKITKICGSGGTYKGIKFLDTVIRKFSVPHIFFGHLRQQIQVRSKHFSYFTCVYTCAFAHLQLNALRCGNNNYIYLCKNTLVE